MKNELDSRFLLTVFEHIQKNGEVTSDGKRYQGVTAFADPDGYTIYLQGSGVLLRSGFHNTYHLDYKHDKHKDDLIKKLEYIYKEANA
ncbi:DUF3081 family protein [Pseudoalteromonas peptidolytica]|uniref:DUF3081 domain-containing protein n=1 Tax=Pseudoalteromonas peptidolytica F12-50-A1 TaxID=1315280 RepID=A0A8I0MZ04_9GAMM|nr:DUF3081 family protein [Pseudoalteromonas peptidolytica]MBE0348682.1 hypothetical protein [Pseudoalteromonas peptidolytica F12-50-A1]NLR15151.1 DUF3081 family protein [Pseudoalteromonas peptidolytica]GEK09583.1 hypothetical protein PPE03_18320 [Pseudoalteromonas peptidolytica]